ncbi:MAG: thioredoxin family protein [Planctomycetota bacterium]|nr:thioredoxin family protein [Planctomycetota bacterium]
MHRPFLRYAAWSLLLFGLASAAVCAEEGFAQVKTYAPEDFSWVPRTLKKAPELKSEKPRYTIWALGDLKTQAMVQIWDESQGTGTGYDTLYMDRNLNGDLSEADEKLAAPFKIQVQEPGSERTYSFEYKMENGKYHWQTRLSVAFPDPNGGKRQAGYSVGLLPGNLQIADSPSLADAPVYRFGGPALPFVYVSEGQGRKKTKGLAAAGDPLGTWTAGGQASVSMFVSLVGDDPSHRLCFYHSQAPGGLPKLSLRVRSADGAAAEEIPFIGGCGCAGSFSQSMQVPRRVPPGTHEVVIRMARTEYAGGKAEYLFPVEILNPEFGKPVVDPAYTALKAKFGASSQLASLRRAEGEARNAKTFPDEPLVPAPIADCYMTSSTMHWDSRIANYGAEHYLEVGQAPGKNAPSRALIRIDLSNVPRDAKIAGAALRFTVSNVPYAKSGADAKVEAFAVRRPWNEVPRDGLHCSWYGPFYKGNKGKPESQEILFWKQGGCEDTQEDRYPDAAGSMDVSNFPAKDELYRLVSLDLTETVRAWVSGKLENHGLVLIQQGGGWAALCSSEHPDFTFRPTLVLALEGGAKLEASVSKEQDLEFARAEARRRKVPLLVKFYSPTCATCKKAEATTLADAAVKAELARSFQFVSLTVEENAKLAQDLGVSEVPAVVALDAEGKAKSSLNYEVLLKKEAFMAGLEALKSAK